MADFTQGAPEGGHGATAPAAWYADPSGSGGQRYWDGAGWTDHLVGPPQSPAPGFRPPIAYGYPPAPWPSGPYGYGPSYQPPWKGAQYGRPPEGPGALANPGRRLVARFLDGLVILPVFVVLGGIAIALVAPHIGPWFPKVDTADPNATTPTPGFVWIYLVIICVGLFTGVLFVAYETIATARFGRTLGKAWMGIRPVRIDGAPMGWGRSLGRVALYWLSGFLSYIGLLDPLWCLWDGGRQCLHDKAVGTIVVND